jgi:hypothetical protein
MAKCDLWTCLHSLWTPAEEPEARLRNQLEVYGARMRMLDSECAGLNAAKLAAARAGNREAAKQAIVGRRRKEAQLVKYGHLRDFCESALVRIGDVAAVHETLDALGAVRKTIGDAKLEDLYEKFGSAVQEISAGGDAMLDIQSLVSSKVAPPSSEEEDAELLAELDALEAEVLQGAAAAPAAPPQQPPPERAAKPHARKNAPLPVPATRAPYLAA